MKKLSALSPRTNAFMSSGGDPGSEQVTFERMFSGLAYSALSNKVPRLMNSVVTFKILESKVDEGFAQGTFVVSAGDTFIYVPVILSENTVDPPEVFYSKKLDAFLPLDSSWVDEVQKGEATSLGQSSEIPKNVSNGLDVSHMMIPPVSGRITYASAGINLPDFLEQVPNRVKKAYAKFLSENPVSFKEAVRVHGDRLVNSLRPRTEKVASAKAAPAFHVLSSDDSPNAFRNAFNTKAAAAFQKACHSGIVVQENRKHAELSVPVDVQVPLEYQDISDSGTYKVLDSTGRVSVVAVFRDPTDIHSLAKAGGSYQSRNPGSYDTGYAVSNTTKRFLVVFPNGDYTQLDKLVALPTKEAIPDGTLGRALRGRTQVRLRNGKQILVSNNGNVWQAILPFSAANISSPEASTIRGDLLSEWSTGNDGAAPEAGIVISDSMKLLKPHSPSGSNTVFLPRDFISLACGEFVNPATVVSDMSTVLELVNSGIAKLSHARIHVKNCGAGEWSVNGLKLASTKAAVTYLSWTGMDAHASHSFLDDMGPGQVKRAYVVPSRNLGRLGQVFTKAAEDNTALVAQIAGSMAPAMFMQMQNMMAMGPSAGGAPPPGMDPSAGGAPPPGMAPGMDPSAGGAPPPGMAPGMDPSAGAGAGAPPQVDPATGMQMDPSTGAPIDPNTGMPAGGAPGAGAPPQVDPATGAPVDPATGQPIDPATGAPVDQPINPQFMNSAAELQQQGVFDVASVAALLQSPSLTELVSGYLAPLEKSLDSLGRIVLAVKVKAPVLKQEVGQEAFTALDQKLTLVFRGLGELIIRLNQHSLTGVGASDSDYMAQAGSTGTYGQ